VIQVGDFHHETTLGKLGSREGGHSWFLELVSRWRIWIVTQSLACCAVCEGSVGVRGCQSASLSVTFEDYKNSVCCAMPKVCNARSRRTRAAVGLPPKAPASYEELRPWLLEVERARERGMDLPPFRHIGSLHVGEGEWRWTVLCTNELLRIMELSLIPYPLLSNVDENPVVQLPEVIISDGETCWFDMDKSWAVYPSKD
jgi:hypothetical protein